MPRSIRDVLLAPSLLIARLFNPLQPLFGLAARLYVSSQFLLSAYIKVTMWPSTLSLFENEYHVPYLTPQNAAVAGTVGELLVPSLLVLGFLSRLSALGLFVVNALAVIAYRPVLLAVGAEGALGHRILWGTLLMFLILYGPGKLSLDHLLLRPRS
jgi:putative oxidoreductase